MTRLALIALALVLGAGPALAQGGGNAEMARLYAEDQADRQGGPGVIDWKAVVPRDAARREATRKLLAAGALSTGDDFHEAAFVFQHGSTPDDYLLAHTLAVAAVAKGKRESAWIAAATLDRFLQSLERPQVYGTQFLRSKATGTWTQEPYNRNLIPDALRRELGVKTQAEQAADLKALPPLPPPPKP